MSNRVGFSWQKIVSFKSDDAIFAYQYFLAIRFVVSMLVSIVMVRSSLGIQELGNFEVIMFVIQIMSYAWSIGFKNAALSYFSKLSQDKISVFFSTITWLLLIFSLICSFFWLIFPGFVVSSLTNYQYLPELRLSVILLFVSVPTVAIDTILYLKNKARPLMIYTHWSQGLYLILMILIAIFEPNLESFLIGSIVFSAIKLGYLFLNILKDGCFKLDLHVAKIFIVFSLPLILNVFLASTMDMIDGLFVTHYFDQAFFPVFKYGARELPFSSLLFSSLSAAMIPIIASNGSSMDELKVRATKLMHWVFPLAIAMIFLSPYLFTLVYGIEFKESAYIFNIYLLILISRIWLPQTINFALHQHKIINVSSIFEILLNIGLSYCWVDHWGVYGLAMATVVSYLAQKVVLLLYNYYVNGIKINQYIDLKWFGIYSLLLCFGWVITAFNK